MGRVPVGAEVAYPAPTTDVQVIKPDPPANANAWKDVPFAILFIAHLIAIILVMAWLGVPLLKDLSDLSAIDSEVSNIQATIMAFTGCMAVVASLVACALINFVVAFARRAISFVLWANVTLFIVLAVVAVVTQVAILTVIFILLAVLSLCYIRMVRSRIPFAAANLHVAAAAVKDHWSIFPLAFIMVAFQVIWIFIWCVAFIGVVVLLASSVPNPAGYPSGFSCSYNSDCQSNDCDLLNPSMAYKTCQGSRSGNGQVVAYVLMLLSLYWGMTVMKNVLHSTVAGVVATWWTAGDARGVIRGSFRRAMTTSFGSICLGSLIVSILRVLEALANGSKQKGGVAACIAGCILGLLRSIIEYFNRWAFIYVAMYGFRFTQAGKCAFGLFKQRGLSAVVNDDLIGQTLAFVSLVCGLICCMLGLAYTSIDQENAGFAEAKYLFSVIGFVFGLGVTIIPLSVIDSAVATAFVCFAEDPVSFGRTHQALHHEMVAAWRLAHPDIMLVFYPA
ncbi:putative choline transporter, neither null mutation nor overexpression affects choline transport [Aphanomyces cochlioides]|nr:putative choline transporter, neither null mutation nor overexpression affects choline transport [Aphanomyces cochlioides]